MLYKIQGNFYKCEAIAINGTAVELIVHFLVVCVGSALSSLRGLRGAPEGPPLCRESSVSRTANVGMVGKNGSKHDVL